MLVNKKADINAKDIIGMTPAHYAIDSNKFESLKYAIENGADLEAKDKCGYTLLLRAGKYHKININTHFPVNVIFSY